MIAFCPRGVRSRVRIAGEPLQVSVYFHPALLPVGGDRVHRSHRPFGGSIKYILQIYSADLIEIRQRLQLADAMHESIYVDCCDRE